MGVKYTIPFKATDNKDWRVDILLSTYGGDPITMVGVGGQACVLEWTSVKQDDPFSPFVTSTLTLNLYNEGQVDIREFQRATDRQYQVKIYRQNALYWSGYLDSKDTQRPLASPPYDFSLSAKDGLSFLDDIPYVHNNLQGTGTDNSRCPLNYIRQILFSNLNMPLPIKWINGLECTAFPGQDVMSGGVQWASHGEGFEGRSCGYILEGLIKSMGCRIYQSGGAWVIRRVNDSVTGVDTFKQVSDSLGKLVIATGTENIRKKIGRDGYRMINEDQLMINKPGLKSFKVEYKADVRENILPNGNFDSLSLGYPLYWGTLVNPNLGVEVVSSLDGRDGNAVKLDYFRTMGIEPQWGLLQPLPIDAYLLVKRINISLLFSPISWVLDDNEFVNFADMPFYIRFKYRIGPNTYYLNEFGFWTTVPTSVNIRIEGMKLDEVANIKFDKFQGVILPQPPAELEPDDTCDLQVIFIMARPNLTTRQTFTIDSVAITIEDNNDVYENIYESTDNTMTDDTDLNISSSFSGYLLGNFMTEYYNSDQEFHFRDKFFYEGSLTGMLANSVMRFRYKPSEIFTGSILVEGQLYTFDEIYLIDSMLDSTFMPLSASYNIEKCQVLLNAMECRNDNVIFTEKFYGSNADILSN